MDEIKAESLIDELKSAVISDSKSKAQLLIDQLEDRHQLLDEEKELIRVVVANVAHNSVLKLTHLIDSIISNKNGTN